jgi:hypothetical protein
MAARTTCDGGKTGRVERQGADLDGDLAVDGGVGDLIVGAGRRRSAGARSVRFRGGGVGEDAQDVVGRDFGAQLFLGRAQGRGDLGEGAKFYEVALALAGDRAHLEDLPAGDLLLDRPHAVALLAELVVTAGLADLEAKRVRQVSELIRVVERRHQGAAHQEDRGQTGEDGAAQPADADGPRHGGLVGLFAEIKRRIVAEINGPGADKASQGYVSCRPPHDSSRLPKRHLPVAGVRIRRWRAMHKSAPRAVISQLERPRSDPSCSPLFLS